MLLLALCLGAVLAASPAFAAAYPPPEPGMFLVAGEVIRDSRFRETVILLLRHDRKGSVGLIVNRPTRLPLGRVRPNIPALSTRPETVSFGGPVSPKTLLVLLRSERPPQRSTPVCAGVHATGIGELAEWLESGDAGEDFRVFIGYAGWAPGQLEAEIDRGDWQLLPADGADLFDRDPQSLWRGLHSAGKRLWI